MDCHTLKTIRIIVNDLTRHRSPLLHDPSTHLLICAHCDLLPLLLFYFQLGWCWVCPFTLNKSYDPCATKTAAQTYRHAPRPPLSHTIINGRGKLTPLLLIQSILVTMCRVSQPALDKSHLWRDVWAPALHFLLMNVTILTSYKKIQCQSKQI